MKKISKILVAILGACNVVIQLMTPIAVAIFWGAWFNFSQFFSSTILFIGGLATIFRAVKIGWMKND